MLPGRSEADTAPGCPSHSHANRFLGRKCSPRDADRAGATPCSSAQALVHGGTEGLSFRVQAHSMLRRDVFSLRCKAVGSHNWGAWVCPRLRFPSYRSYTVKAQLLQKVKTKLPILINQAQENGTSVLLTKEKSLPVAFLLQPL